MGVQRRRNDDARRRRQAEGLTDDRPQAPSPTGPSNRIPIDCAPIDCAHRPHPAASRIVIAVGHHSMDLAPPRLPTDRLDGWHRVEERTERPFSAGPVSVTARTVRYERTGDARPRPFLFASRLRIRPGGSPNPALTALVGRRARDGFRNRLADNDIEAADHRDDREITVEDPAASPATLSTFRGRCRTSAADGARGPVPVEALLAVWSTDDYVLAGGAYSLDDTPDRSRRELLRIVRGVRCD